MGLIEESLVKMGIGRCGLEDLDLNKFKFNKSELTALGLETSRLKFVKSKETGELISFVYRHSKTRELKGVREEFSRGKQICVLSKELKERGIVRENVLYTVLMKAMHGGKKGFVVVAASPMFWSARIETTIIPKFSYKVSVSFGNKTIYFDPLNGKSPTSRTLKGVLRVIDERHEIENKDMVIQEFKKQAYIIIRRLETDGYIITAN